MKKTVNINLAGTFFHIDEDAFGKLSRYLDAIKRSLSDPLGGDEIIRDIEARISELFSEKIESNSQVVSIKEVDEVIAVMGQPEDYIMGEETFTDEAPKRDYTTSASHKQLFRDIDNKFVAGVCSGLGHYLKIDAIWVRLGWIFLTFLTSGFGILAYILFWILVPGAESTSEKLKMTGEPINISNIEKKFKEGYQSVSDSIKNADYDKYMEKSKRKSASFFESIGSVIVAILKVFLKFFGLFIMLIGLVSFVGLIVGIFAFGTIGISNGGGGAEFMHFFEGTNTPIWLASLLIAIVAGIPLIILFILGLKIVAPNIKTIGSPAKITLFIIWIGAIIGLSIFGIRQASERAYEDNTLTEISLPVDKSQPFNLAMNSNKLFEYQAYRSGGSEIKKDQNGDRVLYSSDIRLIVRSTNENEASLVIERSAEGKNYNAAKERAEAINYNYSYSNNTLVLDGFFLSDVTNRFYDQELEIVLYLPVNTTLIADSNTRSFHKNDSRYRDILDVGDEGKQLLITANGTRCLDCGNTTETNNSNTITTDDFMDDDSYEDNNIPAENWEDDVNQSLDIKTNKIKEVKVIVNDSLKTKETTITEQF
ncbi:PspC domain-containing protein [Patiriisocius marinus]|uniref:Uncharacterized protein n=1 Tax=Patiriisocius marinus TaxID=1397112 RepID=A0A5J4IVU5_9FLAO|nr:PspC domain-containing protein [Patiriisocius marinus]GER59034.1 hypothetical protein ULMA_11420 [Patiriisocius marinus]